MSRHNLGPRLRSIRKNRNMSIHEVAEETGLHFSTISKYEREEREPCLDILHDLAEVYQVPVGRLVSNKEEVVDYLPEDIKEAASLLVEKRELLHLVQVAHYLPQRQVNLFVNFLKPLIRPYRRRIERAEKGDSPDGDAPVWKME